MKLKPWRKGGEDTTFKHELEELFGRMVGAFDGSGRVHLPEVFHSRSVPPIDVSETETAFTVTAELPGLEQEDIRIELMGRRLRIAAERKWVEETEKEFHRIESQYGSMERFVPLPDGLRLDPDAVEATYEKGILTVTIPKVEPTPVRRIEVKST